MNNLDCLLSYNKISQSLNYSCISASCELHIIFKNLFPYENYFDGFTTLFCRHFKKVLIEVVPLTLMIFQYL